MRIVSFAAFLFLLGGAGYACSSFQLKDKEDVWMGKSFDWWNGAGSIYVNKRSVSKKSVALNPKDNSFEWESKYGSLTFNQHGREFPLGGVNSQGLAIEILWLDSSKYPEEDARNTLNELQWIQYQLDTKKTVADVLAAEDSTRISKVYAKVHYFLCDATGACATVEYLDQKAVVHKEPELTVAAITNDSYDVSIQKLKDYKNFGGDTEIPKSSASLDRFVRIADHLRQFKSSPKNAKEFGFKLLDNVAQTGDDDTQWFIVYSLTSKEVSFRTHEAKKIKTISLSELDWDCKKPVRMIDMNGDLEGNISKKLVDYTKEKNDEQVENGLAGLDLILPKEKYKKILGLLRDYPATTECK